MLFLTEGAAAGGVTEALTTALVTIASDAMSAISAILPIALPIVGAMVVVTLGIKIFKKVTSK